MTYAGANVLAVRLNVVQPCSRWYSGAGIYRHVRLTLANPLHIEPLGVFAIPEEIDGRAEVYVQTSLVHQGGPAVFVVVKDVVFDPQGKKVAEEDSTLCDKIPGAKKARWRKEAYTTSNWG